MEIKFSATTVLGPARARARPPDTCRFFAGHRRTRLLNNLRSGDRLRHRTATTLAPIREDVWRCINLSARECKEDWFPTRTDAEKRGGIEFRPESTSEVVFVIFLTYVWR